MNIWLYKRSCLYRSLFSEELLIRTNHRYRKRKRAYYKEQMKVALHVFENEIKAAKYSEALKTAACYMCMFNEYQKL